MTSQAREIRACVRTGKEVFRWYIRGDLRGEWKGLAGSQREAMRMFSERCRGETPVVIKRSSYREEVPA